MSSNSVNPSSSHFSDRTLEASRRAPFAVTLRRRVSARVLRHSGLHRINAARCPETSLEISGPSSPVGLFISGSTSVPTQSTRSGHSLPPPKNAYIVLAVWRTAGLPSGVAASLRAVRFGGRPLGRAILHLTVQMGSPIC